MPTKQSLNILVRMPNWLGDCVMALPALRHLSETLPGARMYLAGRRQFRELFACQPGVAGFVEAPASGLGELFRGMARAGTLSREAGLPGGFDLGLLFTNSLSTAAWLWRTGSAIRVGYNRDCRRLFLTHPVPCGGVESSWHFINYYMWLAKFAEALLVERETASLRQVEPQAEYLVPSLTVGEAAKAEAGALLAQLGVAGKYAVIAPASAYGAVKDWPADRYRELVGWINEELGLPVLATGGGGQAAVCEEIVRGQKAAHNVAGRTGLPAFAGLLAGSSLFVGGDSGGAHVAAALGLPTVVIFGITNPTRTRPTGPGVRMVGAGRDRDVKLSTPEAREEARLALAAITPAAVADAVREAMARNPLFSN